MTPYKNNISVAPTAGGYRPWRSCSICGRQVPGNLYVTVQEARDAGVSDNIMYAYGHEEAGHTKSPGK